MVLIDTSVWAEWFNARPGPAVQTLDRLLASGEVAVLPLIVTEVLQGFRRDASFERACAVLLRLPMLPLDVDDHVEAARLFRALRKRGVTVRGAADCLIARACIAADVELLTLDRDFVQIARHTKLRLADGVP